MYSTTERVKQRLRDLGAPRRPKPRIEHSRRPLWKRPLRYTVLAGDTLASVEFDDRGYRRYRCAKRGTVTKTMLEVTKLIYRGLKLAKYIAAPGAVVAVDDFHQPCGIRGQ